MESDIYQAVFLSVWTPTGVRYHHPQTPDSRFQTGFVGPSDETGKKAANGQLLVGLCLSGVVDWGCPPEGQIRP